MRRPLVLLLLLLLVAPAAGQVPEGAQGVGLVPAPGRYASASGTFVELGRVPLDRPVTGEVLLRNQGDAARDVFLFSSDAQPARGGGFGFSDRTAADTQVGRWLSLTRERVTVPPRQEVRVGYRVVVPTGTEGGEYVGGIVAQPAEAPSGAGVQSVTRVAVAVYLTVPGGTAGATPGRGRPDGRLQLAEVTSRSDGARVCPVVRYTNDSQQVLDPEVRVSTDGVLGGDSYRKKGVGAVLPGSAAEVRLACLDRPIGPSTLRVRLGAGQVLEDYEERDLYLPWPVALALLLLLLLVLAVVTTALRGRRARSEGAERPTE